MIYECTDFQPFHQSIDHSIIRVVIVDEHKVNTKATVFEQRKACLVGSAHDEVDWATEVQVDDLEVHLNVVSYGLPFEIAQCVL